MEIRRDAFLARFSKTRLERILTLRVVSDFTKTRKKKEEGKQEVEGQAEGETRAPSDETRRLCSRRNVAENAEYAAENAK